MRLVKYSAAVITVVAWTGASASAQDRPAAEAAVERPNADMEELGRALESQDRAHTLRTAKIRRLCELAQQSGDTAKVERINALERRQQALHDRQTSTLRSRMGDDAFDARRAALQQRKQERRVRAAESAGGGSIDRPNVPRVNAPANTTIRRPNVDARTGPEVGTPSRPNVPTTSRPSVPTTSRPNVPTTSRPSVRPPARPTTPTTRPDPSRSGSGRG